MLRAISTSKEGLTMSEDSIIITVFVIIPIVISSLLVFFTKSTPARVFTVIFILLTCASCFFAYYIFQMGKMGP